MDYSVIRALSHEGREKLSKVRPHSLGQASRIPGLRPGDIQVLYIHLEKSRREISRVSDAEYRISEAIS